MTTNCFAVSRILGERTFTRNLRLQRTFLQLNVYSKQYILLLMMFKLLRSNQILTRSEAVWAIQCGKMIKDSINDVTEFYSLLFLAPTRSSRKANVRSFVRSFVRPSGSNLSRALKFSAFSQGLFRVSSGSF